jgi:hypothetical protein
MPTIQDQLEKEAGYDVRVAIVGLILFFGCMLILPRSAFWFYFVPLAAFWIRYILVRERRDEALLRADVAASGRSSTAGCYRSEAGICITDGTHHVLVARDNVQAPLQLPYIVGRK